ncbi:hypothetical protein KRX57_04140 [Weeksellaceae bacterium TAE3-ERU29]|nr:hypothetical protein [Weeksellaceae bacterium TAE3-ERU29]
MNKHTLKNIKLEELVLDKENPRFAELYSGSDKEQDLIEYLLFTESAEEVANAISEANEFYPDRPLWVLQKGSKYIVKDGNRRCASVKALKHPKKYGLDLPKMEIDELPVLIYHNESDLDIRIRQEHTGSLFKKWGRIAKALEIYRLLTSGNSIESLSKIDSNPRDFIKIASFYHEAVQQKGENFKKLVREGRGKMGGKTIIFERLFRERKECGYNFGTKDGRILIKDKHLFESYINAIVAYLINHPDTTSRKMDEIYRKGESFLDLLKPYGFPPQLNNSSSDNSQKINTDIIQSKESLANNDLDNNSPFEKPYASNTNNSPIPQNTNNSSTPNQDKDTSSASNKPSKRHSIKTKPTLKRKGIPRALTTLIRETYDLNQNDFANAKTALTRVTFECILKYIIENTNKPNGKKLKESNHFSLAYKNKRGEPLPYTNFDTLKSKFTELIIDTGIKKAFENFDLQNSHQIIHNYRVGAIPADAKGLCDNLIDLVEFMLQDEADLLNSIDLPN